MTIYLFFTSFHCPQLSLPLLCRCSDRWLAVFLRLRHISPQWTPAFVTCNELNSHLQTCLLLGTQHEVTNGTFHVAAAPLRHRAVTAFFRRRNACGKKGYVLRSLANLMISWFLYFTEALSVNYTCKCMQRLLCFLVCCVTHGANIMNCAPS